MVVKVKLLGEGTSRDPWRVPIPTYVELLTLPEQGVAYVVIPDADHPELDAHDSAKTEQTGHGPALIALDNAGHAEWYRHLDERYAEHSGKFRPEVAE